MFAQSMDRFTELSLAWGWLLCLAAWRALPLILIVVGLKFVLRQRISPAVHALLWSIVLVRFLLPFSAGSPLSLHGLSDSWFARLMQNSDVAPSAQPVVIDRLLPNVAAVEAAGWDLQLAPARPAEARIISWEEMLGAGLLLVLVVPTLALLLRSFVAHIRFAIVLRSCRSLEDQELIDVLLRECDALGVGRRPALREVPTLAVPAVFGLLRHTICFPPDMIDALSAQELRWVLRHELAHIRRRDILLSVIGSIAAACHWFNPLIWLTTSRLRAAIEAAADRLALTNLSPTEAHAYGHLLLRLAQGGTSTNKSPALGLLPFASGKQLKQRVALLAAPTTPMALPIRLSAVLLVIMVALAGLTDAREVKVLERPEIHLPFSELMSARTESKGISPWNFKDDKGEVLVKSYDVETIFNSMPQELLASGVDRKMMLLRWLPLPTEIDSNLQLDGTTLTASLTTPQHELLQRTLQAWQSGEPRQIVIETRFLQTDLQTASSIDWIGKRIDSLAVEGLGPAIAARISEVELKNLIMSAQHDARSNVIFAPRVTAYAGQTAVIVSGVQRPFVTGAEPRKKDVLQPVISVIDEGLKLTLTPNLRDDGGLKLGFEVVATSIGKVSYANLPILLPNPSVKFTVQVPATERYALRSSIDLAADESIVVAIPRVFDLEPGADTDTTVLVTLTPRLIQP